MKKSLKTRFLLLKDQAISAFGGQTAIKIYAKRIRKFLNVEEVLLDETGTTHFPIRIFTFDDRLVSLCEHLKQCICRDETPEDQKLKDTMYWHCICFDNVKVIRQFAFSQGPFKGFEEGKKFLYEKKGKRYHADF